ncbi:MAG: geopeptide radical SAM maturase [Desulfobulbaceae bacterium]|nr:geopeptide radical SAM maturase [Desulfobulbaceae bacterium]
MPLTPYLFCCDHPSDAALKILFATKTGALILLPTEVWQGLQGGEVAPELGAELTMMGFWVADPVAERQEVQRYLDDINRYKTTLTVAVILGMACNFACRYCYEGAQKGDLAMTDQTAAQLLAYLQGRFGPGKKKLCLDLYGGETLLYKNRIIELARALKPFVEAQGGEFLFNIVTNGSLLTPKVVEELLPWGLGGIKVTLDGLPDNHDHFRPFKSGQGSFEVIVDNLVAVAAKAKIRLGGNYTIDNYRDFPKVLDLLARRGLTPDKFEVVNFNPVMSVKDKIARNEYMGGCAGMHEPWLIEAGPYIREEVFKRGYAIGELGPAPCAVEINDAFTVHYDGSLYKCAVLVGHEQFRIGHLATGIDEAGLARHEPLHWQREAKCRECVYLPMCFGGCRYSAYQRDGHMRHVDCQKEFFDATLATMLRQELKYRYGQG